MLSTKYAFLVALWMTCPVVGLFGQNTFPATGNTGIGTNSPTYPLQVIGNIKSGGAVGSATGITIGNHGVELGAIEFNQSDNSRRFWLQTNGVNTPTERLSLYGGPLNQNATQEMMSFSGTGNVGIGATAPMGKFDVNGVGGFVVSDTNLDPSLSYSLLPLEYSGKLLIGWNRSAGGGEQDLISNRSAGTMGGFNFWDYSNSGVLNSLVTMQGSGNVGIGTTAPGAKLEVDGSVKLTAGSGASVTFQDGSVQTVAWNGVLSGGDYAESVDVIGDRMQYEPGDVLVIDPSSKGKFMKSTEAYSTAVMGIYSTRPGVVGRRQSTDKSHMKEEVPMAMVGVVPTKVSAESGAIKAGDLLVTSSKPGYAMKGKDRSQMMGAIIGKALEPLDAGTGVIEVAVSIQ